MGYERERRELCDFCRLLFQRGLVSGADGNMSVRLAGEDAMLITPSGVCKGFLKPDDLLVQGFDGAVREGTLRSTREAAMHGAIYCARPDAGAILHTHAAYATVFACRGGLPDDLLVEVPALIGEAAVAAYAPPGSDRLAGEAQRCSDHSVILLQNHGVIVTGKNLSAAFTLLDGLENAAKSMVYALLLGDAVRLPPGEAQALQRQKTGVQNS